MSLGQIGKSHHFTRDKNNVEKKYTIAFLIMPLLILTACSNSGDEEKTGSNVDKDVADSMDINNSYDSAESEEVVYFSEPTDNTNNYGRGAISDGADTNADEKPVRILTEDATSIIIYFSRGRNTENVAQQIE